MKNKFRRLVLKTVRLFSVLPLFVLATAQAASFDCGKASTKIEKMVCADAELSKLDEEVAKKYQQAQQALHNAPWFIEQQRLWLAQRNACTDKACLVQLHKKRLGDIVWYQDINKKPTEFYTYTLDINNNPAVCEHMKKVYNAYFRQPWERGSKQLNTPGGVNAFPPYPGMEEYDYTSKEGLDQSLYDLFYIRRPSSPEYDAVPWRLVLNHHDNLHAPDIESCKKGWKKHGAVLPEQWKERYPPDTWVKLPWGWKARSGCFSYLFIADVDVDNDGTKETLIQGYVGPDLPRLKAKGWGSVLHIVSGNSIDNFLEFDAILHDRKIRDMNIGYRRLGKGIPVMRPFILNGTTYWSGYIREWNNADDPRLELDSSAREYPPDQEYMEIFRYNDSTPVTKSVRDSPSADPVYRNIIEDHTKLDPVCRFSMQYHSQKK